MMVPMSNEAMRCLEEKIVATPMELDLALIYGLGFPPFRGGILKAVDQLGIRQFCTQAGELAHLGPCYKVPQLALDMQQAGTRFYR
jgi:3-hydroxyacyl-CoA dehydrogenase/enoyl-CoA hydratase/3-hydroxybutyryl-CoA epimerase/enoyl-CoA isomerase